VRRRRKEDEEVTEEVTVAMAAVRVE